MRRLWVFSPPNLLGGGSRAGGAADVSYGKKQRIQLHTYMARILGKLVISGGFY